MSDGMLARSPGKNCARGAGDPIILTVANGGAGLILIGQDGHDDAEVSVTSRFVFVRREKAAPAEAALVP
ncbi:hypothetical protein [Bradyrhizobium sp. LMG 9283]|uniref:hypothetical protein n=1 Tax=Bradyrhizobium sp. LMG 9283 TaxID=592064 RepID=UPI00388D5CC6